MIKFSILLALLLAPVAYSAETGYFERIFQKELDTNIHDSASFQDFLEKYRSSLSKRDYQLLERHIQKNNLEAIPKDTALEFTLTNILNREFRVLGHTEVLNPKQKIKSRVEQMKTTITQVKNRPAREDEAFLLALMASVTVGSDSALFAQNVDKCKKKGKEVSGNIEIIEKQEATAAYRPGQDLTFEYRIQEKQKKLNNLIPFTKNTKRVFTVIIDEMDQIVHTQNQNDKTEIKPADGINQVVEKIPEDLKPGKYRALLCVETPKTLVGSSSIEAANFSFEVIPHDKQASHGQPMKPAMRRQ